MQRNYIYGARVVPAVSGIQTAKDLVSEMYEIHLSSMCTQSAESKGLTKKLWTFWKIKKYLVHAGFRTHVHRPMTSMWNRVCSPRLYVLNIPSSFGSVYSRHLHIGLSFVDMLRFYHVGMSKQFARRLGTHFRYGLVRCVSIARNFQAQMRFIWWWPSKLWRAPCACCAWLVFNSLSLSPSGCTHVACLKL